VDAGPDATTARALAALRVVRIELVVASHNHADHIGGIPNVVGTIPVRFYMDNGVPSRAASYRASAAALRRSSRTVQIRPVARTFMLGSARIHVLAPPAEIDGDPQNNHSIGLIVEQGAFRMLLTGDSEVEELNYWMDAGLLPRASVLKAAHHGSRNGVTPRLLATVRPAAVVISSGAGNEYGHPHASALRYYATGGRRVWRTDTQGTVTIHVSPNGAFQITSARGSALLAPTPTH
jgi:competence protein ComEC